MSADEITNSNSSSFRGLADFEDDLLMQIASHLMDPLSLCRLGASAKTFRRLIMGDGAAATEVWSPLLQRIGCCPSNLPLPPSLRLFRNLSSISSTAWSSLRLRSGEPQSLYSQRLRGLTGAACCRLHSSLLLFGGTLNGNAGPVFGDLLLLRLNTAAGELHVQLVVAGDDAADDDALGMGLPGARRGHSMTESSFADGTPVAVLLGGWGYEEFSMDPFFLTSRPDSRAGATHL